MTMTNTARGSTVVGVFAHREEARRAIEALKDDGFAPDSISILSPDKQATQEIAEDTGTHAGAGAATGAITGGVLGGLGGWLVGIGALAIPGVGPFIAAGAFATALGGAAIGAGVGAIAGALMGMGVPEEHAKYYEGEAKAGKTLVTVRASTRYDDAQRILRQHGAYDIESRDGPGATGRPILQSERAAEPAAAGQNRLQLREEEREEARIEGDAGMASGGGRGANWDQVMPTYRQRWQERSGSTGGRWEDAEPGYRYGYETRSRPEYHGRGWSEVEPEVQRDWAQRYPGTPWDQARESVRETWDS